jgi:hypothetical protein
MLLLGYRPFDAGPGVEVVSPFFILSGDSRRVAEHQRHVSGDHRSRDYLMFVQCLAIVISTAAQSGQRGDYAIGRIDHIGGFDKIASCLRHLAIIPRGHRAFAR